MKVGVKKQMLLRNEIGKTHICIHALNAELESVSNKERERWARALAKIMVSTLWTPLHGRALEGSDPHELAGEFEVCQMKGTHIGASELTLFKSYEIGLLRIRPLCFWTIK